MVFGKPQQRRSNLDRLRATQWVCQREDDGGQRRELQLHNLVLDMPCIDYLIAKTKKLQIQFHTARPFESVSIQRLDITGFPFLKLCALVICCVASEVHIVGAKKSSPLWLRSLRRNKKVSSELGEENRLTVQFLRNVTMCDKSSINSLVFEHASVSQSMFGSCIGRLFIDSRCKLHALRFHHCRISHLAARAIGSGLKYHVERSSGRLQSLVMEDCEIETEATPLMLVDCLSQQDPSHLKHLTLTYKHFRPYDVHRIVRILQKHKHLLSLRVISKNRNCQRRITFGAWKSFASSSARNEERKYFNDRVQKEVLEALQGHAYLTTFDCALFRECRDITALLQHRYFLHQLRFLQDQQRGVGGPVQVFRALAVPAQMFPFLLERLGSKSSSSNPECSGGSSLMFMVLQQIVVPALIIHPEGL